MFNFTSFLKRYRLEFIIFLSTLVIFYLYYFFNRIAFTNDDQFTLYRYINNIARGDGFVFNKGEHFLGSTTPFFTLIIAFIKYFLANIDTQKIVAYSNIFLMSVSSVYFYKLCKFFVDEKFSILGTLLFSFSLSHTSTAGMETPLFILTTLLFLYYLFRDSNYLSAFYLGLVIFTRPDAGLIALLAFIFWWQKKGFVASVKYSLVSLLVILPWIIFSILYFGSPIPQSLITKIHINDIVNQSRIQAFKVETSHLSRIYWGKIFDPNNIPLQVVFNLFPILFFLYLFVKEKINKNNWIIFAIPVVYFVSFGISNPVFFRWYWSQVEPFWILMSFVGFLLLLEKVNKIYQLNRYFKIFLITLVFVGPVFAWSEQIFVKKESSKTPLYKMAMYVKGHIKDGEKVGLSNIGIVSYYLPDAYIIDFIGLTRNDVLKFYPIKNDCLNKSSQYVIPPDLIMEKKPDWIIAGEGEWVPCFLNGDWFKNNYEPVYSVNTAVVWKIKK